MRFLNHDGRATLRCDEQRGIDLERASDGRLPSDPAAALEVWPDVVAWSREQRGGDEIAISEELIGPPSPQPRQIIGVGLNYASHAVEAGVPLPEEPMIFPKLSPSIAGPYDEISVSTGAVDWEIELAVVIGRRARRVAAPNAWDYIAGLTIGQDLSERTIQLRPADLPQYSLGKSLPGFSPIGPEIVTAGELDDPTDVELTGFVNGELVQRGRTSDFVFTIAQIVEYLSQITNLYPGDVILTGTPAGIGATRTPPRFLSPGDVLESRITGIGTMRHRFVAEATPLGRDHDATAAVR